MSSNIIQTNNIACIYKNTNQPNYNINPPSIIFDNIDSCLNTIEYYDYSLFRFSINVQTARKNNEVISITPNNNINTVNNFSKYCIGQLQVYPKSFINPTNQSNINNYMFLINNEINETTNYQITPNVEYAPNGRLFYSSNVMSIDMNHYISINCKYENNKSILSFLFNNYNTNTPTETLNFIYSIQVELLNPGKLSKNIINTINFDNNI